MEEFREIEFKGVKLCVYKNGEIWRWMKSSKYWKIIGSINSDGYYNIKLNNKMYKVHRIVAMVYLDLDITDTKLQVDHIDRCRNNNNVDNLRLLPHNKNMWNSTCKGYSWHKQHKKWQVELMVNYKNVYRKYWETEEEAAADYIKQKEIYHKID
jgi:hypothetical protein